MGNPNARLLLVYYVRAWRCILQQEMSEEGRPDNGEAAGIEAGAGAGADQGEQAGPWFYREHEGP